MQFFIMSTHIFYDYFIEFIFSFCSIIIIFFIIIYLTFSQVFLTIILIIGSLGHIVQNRTIGSV